MKKGYRIFTSILVVGMLIMTGGSAMADWTTTANTNTVLVGANAAQLILVGTVASPVYTLGAAEGLGVGDTFTITMTGGVTFSALPTITLAAGAAALSSGGTAGSTSATFRVTTAVTTNSAITFNFINPGFAVLNVQGMAAGANADFLMTLNNSAGGVIVANKSLFASIAGGGGFYPFVARNLMTVGNPGTNADVADVLASSGPYTKFLGNAVAGTINAASLTLTSNAGAFNIPAVNPVLKKVLITLTGDFVGISRILTTAGAPLTGSDSAGTTTGGLAGEYLINADKTAAYAVNNATFITTSACPQFFIDGTTAQVARPFTAKVENLVDGAVWVANTWLSPATTYQITRNGFFFAANSLGPLNTIKISDKSGRVPIGGAKVFVTAWDVNGVSLAQAAGVADILLQNHQTIALTGTALAARFVGTPMKYEFIVQTTNGIVTNIKTTTGGVNTTIWSIVTGGI